MHSLRDRLRSDTARYHRKVDETFSRFDVARRGDLVTLFWAQLSAIEAVRCRSGAGQESVERLRRDIAAALEVDLDHLGGQKAKPLGLCLAAPLAVEYILLGSRAGTRLLARRWCETRDGRVAGAAAYFKLEPTGRTWRGLCEELSCMPPHGEEADRIVKDAIAIFELHQAACLASQTTTGALNG